MKKILFILLSIVCLTGYSQFPAPDSIYDSNGKIRYLEPGDTTTKFQSLINTLVSYANDTLPDADSLLQAQVDILNDSIDSLRYDIDNLVTVETDPVYSVSVASGITGTDTTNWNDKLDSYTETDPVYSVSVASGITGTDTSNWNNNTGSGSMTANQINDSVNKQFTLNDTMLFTYFNNIYPEDTINKNLVIFIDTTGSQEGATIQKAFLGQNDFLSTVTITSNGNFTQFDSIHRDTNVLNVCVLLKYYSYVTMRCDTVTYVPKDYLSPVVIGAYIYNNTDSILVICDEDVIGTEGAGTGGFAVTGYGSPTVTNINISNDTIGLKLSAGVDINSAYTLSYTSGDITDLSGNLLDAFIDTSIVIDAYDYLLDDVTDEYVAWGVRKLSPTYSGNCLRLIRNSDDTESDFGFVNNLLDTASINSWLAGSIGYIDSVYDQTGNNRTLGTSPTKAEKPRIDLSTLTVPSFYFDASTYKGFRCNAGTVTQPFSISMGYYDDGTARGGTKYIFDQRNGGSHRVSSHIFLGSAAGDDEIDVNANTSLRSSLNIPHLDHNIYNYVVNGASSTLHIDATEYLSGDAGVSSFDLITIGVTYSYGSNFMKGYMTEFIIWNKALDETDRSNIVTILGGL